MGITNKSHQGVNIFLSVALTDFFNFMALSKERKKEIVKELKDLLKKQKSMVFVNLRGLSAEDVFQIREALKENNSILKVVKKSLAGISFKEEGIEFNQEMFEDQLAAVFNLEDELISSKILYEKSKDLENLEILGGYLDNEFINQDKVIMMAQLPSKEELLAKLTYILNYPIRGFVNVLSGNIKGLIYTLQAIVNK